MAESLFCDVIVFCLHGGPLENLVGFHLFLINCAAFSVTMVQCCVYNCLNESVHQSDNKKRYFFHRFCKDKSLRKQYLLASGRDRATFRLENAVICG